MKLIHLTEQNEEGVDKGPMAINVDHIILIMKGNSGRALIHTNTGLFYFKESYEDVLNMLEPEQEDARGLEQ